MAYLDPRAVSEKTARHILGFNYVEHLSHAKQMLAAAAGVSLGMVAVTALMLAFLL